MRNLILKVAAIGAAAAITTSAFALFTNITSIKASTAATRSSTSGHTGTEVKVGTTSDFIYGLEWSEEKDDPCWMNVYTAHAEDGKWHGTTAETHVGSCAKKESSRKMIYLQAPFVDDTTTSAMRFVRAIQVCTSEKKASYDEKLKGIRVKALRVTEAGKIEEDNATESAERTNCKTWEDLVSCPAGQAATKLVMNVGTVGNGATAYTGIALDCAEVVVTTKKAAGAKGK